MYLRCNCRIVCSSLSLQEHTDRVYGVQFDDFQLISCGWDDKICIHDFLDPVSVDPIIAS